MFQRQRQLVIVAYCLIDRASRGRVHHPVLTGNTYQHPSSYMDKTFNLGLLHIGICIRPVGDLVIIEDPNKRQTVKRKVDIENL
ncbi:hypothetical protein Tco_1162488, partial [Tanacetum coccineum]